MIKIHSHDGTASLASMLKNAQHHAPEMMPLVEATYTWLWSVFPRDDQAVWIWQSRTMDASWGIYFGNPEKPLRSFHMRPRRDSNGDYDRIEVFNRYNYGNDAPTVTLRSAEDCRQWVKSLGKNSYLQAVA